MVTTAAPFAVTAEVEMHVTKPQGIVKTDVNQDMKNHYALTVRLVNHPSLLDSFSLFCLPVSSLILHTSNMYSIKDDY